jgi:hypothetical protein
MMMMMKKKAVLALLAVLLVLLASILASPVYGQLNSAWTSTTSIPTANQYACVSGSGSLASYIYCITGGNSYYATISPNGAVGTWTSTTVYPLSFVPNCVSYNNYIYCTSDSIVSGYSTASYYAQLTSSGIGTWISTTAYPLNVEAVNCVQNGGYIICIGGYPNTQAVYSAPLLTSGIGAWTAQTNYPSAIYQMGCAVLSNTVYCVGGYINYWENLVYSAPLTNSGTVGTWTQDANYPVAPQEPTCFPSSKNELICAGGSTPSGTTANVYYYSPSTNTWTQDTSHSLPQALSSGGGDNYVEYNSYVILVGGNTGSSNVANVYYAQLGIPPASASISDYYNFHDSSILSYVSGLVSAVVDAFHFTEQISGIVMGLLRQVSDAFSFADALSKLIVSTITSTLTNMITNTITVTSQVFVCSSNCFVATDSQLDWFWTAVLIPLLLAIAPAAALAYLGITNAGVLMGTTALAVLALASSGILPGWFIVLMILVAAMAVYMLARRFVL